MKAVQIHRHGGVEQLCYEECAEPELKSPSDTIIKLKAAALNPIDIRTRRGLSGSEFSFPHILGSDGAGIVVSAGKDDRNVEDSRRLAGMLQEKGVPANLHLWDGWAHDWPYWKEMVDAYL